MTDWYPPKLVQNLIKTLNIDILWIKIGWVESVFGWVESVFGWVESVFGWVDSVFGWVNFFFCSRFFVLSTFSFFVTIIYLWSTPTSITTAFITVVFSTYYS